MTFSKLNTQSSHNVASRRVPQFEEHLSILASSQAVSTSTSLIHNLGGLKDLYDRLDELLLLQPNHSSIFQCSWVDYLLDASLRFLDVCGSAKDALLQMEECIQSIQSLLRRRGSGEFMTIANQVSQYTSSRKKIKQAIKGSKTVLDRCSGSKNDARVSNSMVGISRQVEAVTANIFGSLLLYIASPKAQPKKSRWSVLVSKVLVHTAAFDKNQVASTATSEFDKLDVAIPLFVSHNNNNNNNNNGRKGGIDILEEEKLRSRMVNLEAEIQQLDGVLECMFRRLVQTRAILLNILSA